MSDNIVPVTICRHLGQRLSYLSVLTDTSPLGRQIKEATQGCFEHHSDLTSAMTAIHRIQRLYLIHALDLQNNPAVAEIVHDEGKFPLWKNYATLEAEENEKENLARLMYEGDVNRASPVFLGVDDYSRDISEKVVQRFIDEKDEVDIWMIDSHFMRRILLHTNEEQAKLYGELLAVREDDAARLIELRSNNPSMPYHDPEPNKSIKGLLVGAVSDHRKKFGTQNTMYTITLLPTPEDAEKDKIPYPEYVNLFFRMCNVDWKEMDKAHKHLIAKMNIGSILRFTNDDGTDISMDIGGFTFANSLVAKNIPGSEIFSAPRRDSVNGKIVSKGRFTSFYQPDKIIENIELDFENGKIVRYQAESGEEYLKQLIETDEGSYFIGEIGIGTNPVLKRHVVNSLMVEKIVGSFHVAIGDTYTMKNYMGVPVNLDNGNRSKVHSDITTMLFGKNGRMILDGEVLYENDRWPDPRLAYLNGPQ